MGDAAGAFATLSDGLAVAELAGDAGARLQMVLRLVFAHEAADDLAGAWPYAMLALQLANRVRDLLEFLSAGSAVLRLKRKADKLGMDKEGARARGFVLEQRAFESFTEHVRREMLALIRSSDVRIALRSRPSLHTEVAAELGEEHNELQLEAISQRGVTPEDLLALRDYVPRSKRSKELMSWIYDVDTSRGLGRRLAEFVPEYPGFFADRLRLAVEDSLRRTVDPRGAAANLRQGTLDKDQREQLIDVIATRFTSGDLELLFQDSFDVRLDAIVGPNTSPRQRATELVAYAMRNGTLPQLVDSLADSHRRDENLQRLSSKRRQL
jgi:hypothetical protein